MASTITDRTTRGGPVGLPGNFDFTVWRGNTFSVSMALKDALGDAIDLTGDTLVFRSEWPSGSFRLESGVVSTGGALTVTSATGGVVTLDIYPDQTRVYPLNIGIDYEIERRNGSTEKTFLYGRINAIGGVNDDA